MHSHYSSLPLMKPKSLFHSLLVALAALAPVLRAAIVTPLLSTDGGSVTSSTTFQDAPRTIDSALDGSGLTAVLTEANILTVEHTPATISDNHFLTSAAQPVANEVLTFDLGGTFDISDIYLWQYHRPQVNRGVINFDIAFSSDGGSTFGTAVAASSLGITDFALGATGGNALAQQRTFAAPQPGVTAIQLTNIQNNGDARIGIPEIRFGGTVVPEPSTSALLLGVFGAFVLRRRRN